VAPKSSGCCCVGSVSRAEEGSIVANAGKIVGDDGVDMRRELSSKRAGTRLADSITLSGQSAQGSSFEAEGVVRVRCAAICKALS
jgi:hypothetical protein